MTLSTFCFWRNKFSIVSEFAVSLARSLAGAHTVKEHVSRTYPIAHLHKNEWMNEWMNTMRCNSSTNHLFHVHISLEVYYPNSWSVSSTVYRYQKRGGWCKTAITDTFNNVHNFLPSFFPLSHSVQTLRTFRHSYKRLLLMLEILIPYTKNRKKKKYTFLIHRLFVLVDASVTR